ncbi:MAG: META domain-containing protein [Candidatus Azobacteroides sp.]|nr:META domain-containing protein [Candidatus Azobacteroides sp.]
MKNFFLIICACFFILGTGMNACKSQETAKQEAGKPASVISSTKTDEILGDKKWKLFEINGIAISEMKPQPTIEAFMTFNVTENRVSGNSGCNDFAGTYKIGPDNRLNFSGMISTRKMCMDNMTVEDEMNKIFQAVDNYTLQDGILSLNQAQTPLARFTAE